MGQGSAQTVEEIESVREDLEDKMRELESRLPAPAVLVKRVAGVAVGGGAGSAVFWFGVRRLRNRRSRSAEDGKDERSQGDNVQVIHLVSPQLAEAARPWMVGAAVVWVVLRLAQLRATRRTNDLLRTSSDGSAPSPV